MTPEGFQTGYTPGAATISQAVGKVQSSDLVVIDTGWANAEQQSLEKGLVTTGKPMIAVADPYDINLFPRSGPTSPHMASDRSR